MHTYIYIDTYMYLYGHLYACTYMSADPVVRDMYRSIYPMATKVPMEVIENEKQ